MNKIQTTVFPCIHGKMVYICIRIQHVVLVLSANDITFFLYSCYLENNPTSNDIIHICCQLFSNYLRECVVFLSMLVLMPLLSVEVLLCIHVCTMTITSYLGDWAQ